MPACLPACPSVSVEKVGFTGRIFVDFNMEYFSKTRREYSNSIKI
jgi:hypothetical protein